jgi:hypothetical protein
MSAPESKAFLSDFNFELTTFEELLREMEEVALEVAAEDAVVLCVISPDVLFVAVAWTPAPRPYRYPLTVRLKIEFK